MNRMIDKVRKLLELANHNTNVHEASAAAARAQALMEEHRITEAMLAAAKPAGTAAAPDEEIVKDVLQAGSTRLRQASREARGAFQEREEKKGTEAAFSIFLEMARKKGGAK